MNRIWRFLPAPSVRCWRSSGPQLLITEEENHPLGGAHEVRVKSINGFERPQPDGSLSMENGSDYVISVGDEPAVSFTNEWGEYLLKFRRVLQGEQ